MLPSPYGAPSLVEIVMLFGENVLVSDKAGVVAVNVADAFALPRAPVQASEYVCAPAVVTVTLWLPAVGSVPLQAPLAVQEVAFVEDQVRMTCCPTNPVDALADNATVGGPAGSGCVGDLSPPQPVEMTRGAATIVAKTYVLQSILTPRDL